jgi:hypothetical protein
MTIHLSTPVERAEQRGELFETSGCVYADGSPYEPEELPVVAQFRVYAVCLG